MFQHNQPSWCTETVRGRSSGKKYNTYRNTVLTSTTDGNCEMFSNLFMSLLSKCNSVTLEALSAFGIFGIFFRHCPDKSNLLSSVKENRKKLKYNHENYFLQNENNNN